MIHEIKDLSIRGIETFKNREEHYEGMYIKWDANIGFGEYMLVCKNGKWKGDSESMDRGEDKTFLKMLFDKLIEQVEVVG